MNSVTRNAYRIFVRKPFQVSIRNEEMVGDLNRLGIMSWQVFVSSGLNQPVLLLCP